MGGKAKGCNGVGTWKMEDADGETLFQEDERQDMDGTAASWLLCPFLPAYCWQAGLSSPTEPYQSVLPRGQLGIWSGRCAREGGRLEELSNAHFFHAA